MSKKEKKVMPKSSAELSDESANEVSGGFSLPKFHAGFEDGEFKIGLDRPKSKSDAESTKKIKDSVDYFTNFLKK
ncbi:MAG: hypothetical protein RUMPE_00251 [Eubacteriales bacterium SKADARSKE-1]|nr:hypothetical protein [Eubacteriales bacterium SKADARSKE-1]